MLNKGPETTASWVSLSLSCYIAMSLWCCDGGGHTLMASCHSGHAFILRREKTEMDASAEIGSASVSTIISSKQNCTLGSKGVKSIEVTKQIVLFCQASSCKWLWFLSLGSTGLVFSSYVPYIFNKVHRTFFKNKKTWFEISSLMTLTGCNFTIYFLICYLSWWPL